jgi:hypothetical protein
MPKSKCKVRTQSEKVRQIMSNDALAHLVEKCAQFEEEAQRAQSALRTQIKKNIEQKEEHDKKVAEMLDAFPGALAEWEAHKAKHEEAEEVLQELGYSYQEGMGYVHKDDQEEEPEPEGPVYASATSTEEAFSPPTSDDGKYHFWHAGALVSHWFPLGETQHRGDLEKADFIEKSLFYKWCLQVYKDQKVMAHWKYQKPQEVDMVFHYNTDIHTEEIETWMVSNK